MKSTKLANQVLFQLKVDMLNTGEFEKDDSGKAVGDWALVAPFLAVN